VSLRIVYRFMGIKVCGILPDKSSEEAMEILVALMSIFPVNKTVIPLFKNAYAPEPVLEYICCGRERQHVRMFYCRRNSFADCSYDMIIDKGILEKEYDFIQKPRPPMTCSLK
jgi:hypothetical protein